MQEQMLMVENFFRSPAVADTILLMMLLAWLGGSAIMTWLAGHDDHRLSDNGERRPDHQAHTASTFPPAATQVTGPIRP